MLFRNMKRSINDFILVEGNTADVVKVSDE